MDFRDFLKVAGSLAQGKSEAEWRSASSRAYYAAFHVACEFLGSLGFQVPRMERAHAFAWLRLSNASFVEIVKAGQDLNELRSDRNIADYSGDKPFGSGRAKSSVETAREILKTLVRIVTLRLLISSKRPSKPTNATSSKKSPGNLLDLLSSP